MLSIHSQLNEALDVVVHFRYAIGNLAGCAGLAGRGYALGWVTQAIRRRQNPAGYLLERHCQSLHALGQRTSRFADRDSPPWKLPRAL